MNIIKLQLLTNDIQGTENFYSEILCLPLISKDQTSISFSAGSSILSFELSAVKKPVYHFAFNIPTNKVQETFSWLHSKVTVLSVTGGKKIEDFINWNAKAIYCLDNNGNIVEFIARFDLNNSINKPFDASCIYCISEIGLVTEDVLRESKSLMEKYNLTVFKQSSNEDFTAIGDNEGLFIVVSKTRKWFPTNIQAEQFQANVILSGNKKVTELNYHNS